MDFTFFISGHCIAEQIVSARICTSFCLRTWVVNSADPTQAMHTIVDTGMTQLLQADRNAASDTFPTLTRSGIYEKNQDRLVA